MARREEEKARSPDMASLEKAGDGLAGPREKQEKRKEERKEEEREREGGERKRKRVPGRPAVGRRDPPEVCFVLGDLGDVKYFSGMWAFLFLDLISNYNNLGEV